MSKSSCIYNICVLGNYNKIDLQTPPCFYKVHLYIVKKFHRFEVWVIYPNLNLLCNIFRDKNDAIFYVNKCMKSVMCGKFIFRVCFYCDTKVYYPLDLCCKCSHSMYPTDFWEIDEKENEKKTKHLGFSNYYGINKTYGFRNLNDSP